MQPLATRNLTSSCEQIYICKLDRKNDTTYVKYYCKNNHMKRSPENWWT